MNEIVTEFILNIEKNVNILRKQFIAECAEDECRFERRIKQNKNCTFTKTLKKICLSGKVTEVRLQRDLFGKLLGISLKNSLNLDKVLTYPLTPVPLSLCHIDGTMCKTDKSALLKLLQNNIDKEPPQRIDVIVFEGFFLLHVMKEMPLTFGKISKKNLQMIVANQARTIVITFDRYFSPSIKDNEHSVRETNRSRRYHINDPE